MALVRYPFSARQSPKYASPWWSPISNEELAFEEEVWACSGYKTDVLFGEFVQMCAITDYRTTPFLSNLASTIRAIYTEMKESRNALLLEHQNWRLHLNKGAAGADVTKHHSFPISQFST